MMRLFLLPISTRQSLLYCQRLNLQLSRETTYLDKITTKAATTWLGWEKKNKGWQKKVTAYGNTLFQRLPYEEWGLKSIPPLSARRKRADIEGGEEVRVEYPERLIQPGRVQEALEILGGDARQAFHTKWLWGSIVGMPVTAPMALIPIIPNLPFFYLCFRAWSHWRARSGSKHLNFLLDKKLVKPCPSIPLSTAYAQATIDIKLKRIEKASQRTSSRGGDKCNREEAEEVMLLSPSSGKVIADYLEVPELEAEIERAAWQVEKSLKARQDLKEEEEVSEAAGKASEPRQ